MPLNKQTKPNNPQTFKGLETYDPYLIHFHISIRNMMFNGRYWAKAILQLSTAPISICSHAKSIPWSVSTPPRIYNPSNWPLVFSAWFQNTSTIINTLLTSIFFPTSEQVSFASCGQLSQPHQQFYIASLFDWRGSSTWISKFYSILFYDTLSLYADTICLCCRIQATCIVLTVSLFLLVSLLQHSEMTMEIYPPRSKPKLHHPFVWI